MLTEKDIKNSEVLGPSRFTFNGNIIAEIGEESISNPSIAVAELIKNSYDADSKQVNLDFINLGKISPKISISDDGTGMDSSQIKDKWLDIGSPHKKEIIKTEEEKRIPVGAKGIGRFASHCLGKNMNLITASKKENFGYNLAIDWCNFSKEKKATDVDIKTSRFKKSILTRGTTLIIENLKQNWSDNEKLKSLLKDIYLLNNPLDPPKNFKVIPNIAKDYIKLEKIGKNFLEKHAYHLKVKLIKEKKISFAFYKAGKLIKEDEKIIGESLSCGELSFDLYFYYKSLLTWKTWIHKEISKEELEEISAMLEEYGGIKLYRDKFRVKPYGDRDADWIGLDKWSRDQSMVPGNTQVFGIVSTSRETNPYIEDTTSREGVINNTAYFDLTKFITTSIKLFVDLRGEEEREKAKAKKTKEKKKSNKKLKVESPKVGETPATTKITSFIDIKGNLPTNHYNQLIYEANECEDRNYPNACFYTCRKIIENLVYHILEKKYKDKIDLWYDTLNKRNHTLSRMIKNLYDNRNDFQKNIMDLIEQFNTDVGKFRKDVNSAIHKNFFYLTEKEELKKYNVNKLIQLLVEIYEKM